MAGADSVDGSNAGIEKRKWRCGIFFVLASWNVVSFLLVRLNSYVTPTGSLHPKDDIRALA